MEERIISRAELQSSEIAPPSSPESAQIARIQEFDFVHREELPDASDHDDEEGFSFQLFAGGPTTTISKIRVDSPDLADIEPGLLQPNRPSAYYFTNPTSPSEQQNFQAAAISGQDLRSYSKTIPWPGMSYSWKVTHIPGTKRQRLLLQSSEQTYAKLQAAAKRTRPGKKARIAGRIKLAAVKVEQEAAKRAAETKEVLEKEKRIRRNREKKLKKKEKAKAAKAAGAVSSMTAGGDEEEMESEDGGG